MESKGVFITGTGALASSGIGSRAIWESLVNGRVVQVERTYPLGEQDSHKYPVYPMAKLELTDWVTPDQYTFLEEEGVANDPDFLYLLVVAQLALQEADLKIDPSLNIALIVGHENLGVVNLMDKLFADNLRLEQQNTKERNLNAFYKYQADFFKIQSFPHLFYLAKVLGVGGITLTVNNACASGLYALELGSSLIKTGQADVALVLAADYAHVTEHLWLAQKGFCSSDQTLRPFDKRRNGSVLGDGAAAFVLEADHHVKRREFRPQAVYAGGGFAQDSWKMTLPDVTAKSYSKAIASAISRGGGQRIDLLVPHGAGSPMWDLYEAREIVRTFDEVGLPIPPVTAFKGYVGHTLGASSLLESVLLYQSLLHNLIPPARHHSSPDPKIALPIVTEPIERRLDTVLKTVSAYGGFNAAVVFQKIS